MKRLNINFLIDTSIEELIENIDSFFKKLIQEIQLYFNLEMVFSDVKTQFIEDQEDLKIDIIDFGIKKTLENKILTIFIFKSFRNFLRMILLRLAYKCFVPIELHDNQTINIFINEKVEIDLQDSDFIEEWKEIKRKSVINYEFMEAEFDRLKKFLSQKSTESTPSPFQYFFYYIRRNVDLIRNIKEDLSGNRSLYNLIFQEYAQKYTEYTDEILETIRILKEIFYKVKSYRSILDYQHHFKEFKEKGLIQSALSGRKFNENMQWIKDFTYLAPDYYINWPTINIISTICILRINPAIISSKVIKIFSQIPFFLIPSYSRSTFGIEMRGFFLLPKIYLNDLIKFLETLESNGYIIKKQLFIVTSVNYTSNLNYFRSDTGKNIILSSDKQDYKKEFELEFNMDYNFEGFKSSLSLFDWLLIDRINIHVSITGFGFERKSETLKILKSDLLNEIQSQRKLVSEVQRNLNRIHESPKLREEILEFINNNKNFGFFYNKQMLHDYLTIFELLNNVCLEKSSLINLTQFQEFIKKNGITKAIEDNILFVNLNLNIIRDFSNLFFRSKSKFDFKVEEYRYFYKIFKLFHNLKLFNLETIQSIIKDKSLIQKIYQAKEEKISNYYEQYKIYKITNQALEQRIEDFIKNTPPMIFPSLLSTFITANLTKYHPILILKDNLESREGIKRIKWFFPRIVFSEILEYKTKDKYIYVHLQLPNLLPKEKKLLNSILYYIFQDNIVSIKSYSMSSFQEAFSRKDFYDLEQEDFFYSKDLFEQYYLYIQNTIKSIIQPISEKFSETTRELWGKQKFFSHLINQLENRISKEHIDLNLNDLNSLLRYHKILKKDLLEVERFKDSKNEYFFKNYIKKICFIPSLQSFGFGQYFLYFYPLDLNEIDFKHLLHNSFQKIKYPANIDNSNSFFINFLWPYYNPNISLINWLTKSKRVIREYCLFFIKNVFQIFHFNYNVSINEWDLDPNRFKIYFQNILFNPEYKLTIPQLKEFKIGGLNISNYFTPESPEYDALIKLYNWKSIDIKSYLGTRNYLLVNSIIDLLEKNLIFPFISVKNLDLIEKFYIILPDVKKEHNEKLLKIFSFFNIGFINEIEGEYYIYGMPEEVRFENGLMIKLYLPDCQLDEFEKLFDLVFEYLDIKHYIILNDLVDGKDFLKSIYGNLNFLESYNPLKNLIWNDKDKIWINHKLFDGKFEKIYPDLFPEDNMES